MKKLLLGTLILSSAVGMFIYKQNKQYPWFTLQNIQIDMENRQIIGECIDGPYLGEMIVPVSESFDLSTLTNEMTLLVQGGPAMTMSLPPQLMTVKKIKIKK